MHVLTDLEALLDLPVAVQAAGRDVEIRQIRMHQVPRIQALFSRLGAALDEADEVVLLGFKRPEFIDFLAAATGTQRDWLGEQPSDVLLVLYSVVRTLNPVFFPVASEPAVSSPGDKLSPGSHASLGAESTDTWPAMFTELVRMGHRPADIPHYGLAQFAAYLQAGATGAGSTPPTNKPTLRIVSNETH